jgi:superfamily II DNA or RNA helicase
MQASLAKVRHNLMLLVDECHHLGAPKTLASLSQQYTWRLGLSATPQRWYDDVGSKLMAEFFENGVIYQYTLKDAIGKYLSRYFYYPHLVYLTEDENEEYLELSEKIAKIYAVSGDRADSNDALKLLLLKRSRIINKAENKLPTLMRLVKEERQSLFNLFYCGDSIEDGARQVDRVIYMLGHEIGMNVHPFTSQESKKERAELLSRFSRGDLQGLVAIRCLDEGVDVPATKTAYILASSTNPREFVQRRGRILRKSPGKDYAYIHDFIVVPRDVEQLRNLDSAFFNIERKLMRKELMRFKEFAELAENGPQAMNSILEVANSYNLMDL